MGSLGGKAPLTSCIVFWAMRWAFRVRGDEGCKENSECSHVRVSIKGWAEFEEYVQGLAHSPRGLLGRRSYLSAVPFCLSSCIP